MAIKIDLGTVGLTGQWVELHDVRLMSRKQVAEMVTALEALKGPAARMTGIN